MFVYKHLRPYETKYDIVIVDKVDNMFIDERISPCLLSESCDIIHYKDNLNVIYYNKEKRINILHNFRKNYLVEGYISIPKIEKNN